MGATYLNPVPYADGVARTNPDPFVLRFRGRYWCWSTDETGVNVSTSRDLVTWHFVGQVLADPARRQYWAPCVIHADGLFWMYVSSRPAGSDDPHEEVLQVATSERPDGPFELRRRMFDTFSIDPHVVRDPATGGYVLFYSTNDVTGLDEEGTGTSILVDRLRAMDEPEGRPRPVVVPTVDEEIFERNRFGDGRDWYTIEGATYLTRRDRAYLTYSGNAYVGEDYFIGHSRAELDGGPADLRWTKYPDDHTWAPLVRRDAAVEGTGHNSVVRAPNLVDDWIVYHGRDADQPLDLEVEQRVMRIDPLRVDGDRLTTPAPTSTSQPAPAGATVADDFTSPSPDPRWRTLAGTVTTGPDPDETYPGAPGVARTGRDLLTLVAHDRPTAAHVTEVTVRAPRTDAGARYGVVPVLHDADDHVAVLLDAATATVQVRRVRGRIARTLASAALPAGFDPAHWHLLRVERVFDEVVVQVDGVDLLTVGTGDDRPAPAGLISVGTPTEFSGYGLTEHVDLYGDRLAHLPRLLRADRPVEVTARGIGSTTRRPVVLDGLRLVPGQVLGLDLEVVTPAGYAELVLRTPAGDGLRVRLDADTDHLATTRPGQDQTQVHDRQGRRRTTVRVHVQEGRVLLRSGEHELALTDQLAAVTAHLELAGSLLRGVELTSIHEADQR